MIGTSIISYSSLGALINELYKVFNLSALSKVVETPLAISLVMLLLPTRTLSPYIKLLFSKIDIEVFECPKSIQIDPIIFSSSLKTAKDEDKGEGTKLSILIFNLSIIFL